MNQQLKDKINTLSNDELAMVCEKVIIEYTSLASIMWPNTEGSHPLDVINRCLQDEEDFDTNDSSLIKLNNQTTVRITGHEQQFVPNLEVLIEIDSMVKDGNETGTIVGDNNSNLATWRVV